jgi:ABC-type glycerol-3-phosphate transport system substrate-binding protein
LFDQDAEKYVIDSEPNVAWLDYWVKWLDEQYQGDVEKLNLYGSWDGVGPESAFNQGISALSQGGSWSPTLSDLPFDYEVVKYPLGPGGAKSVTGYWPNWWAIPKGAQRVQEAFTFSEYFCTKGWEIWYKYVLDTPAWKDFPAGVLTEALVEQEGEEKAQDIHNFFAEYLNDTVLMWNSPIEDFASDTMNAAIDEVLHKTKTPAQALQEAQVLCQAKLEETLKSV